VRSEWYFDSKSTSYTREIECDRKSNQSLVVPNDIEVDLDEQGVVSMGISPDT
jgi:hypothetical protein